MTTTPLHGGEVVGADRVLRGLAEAGQREELLDDHRPAE